MKIFDSDSLERAVGQALQDAKIPPGDTKAFSLVALSNGDVKAVLSVKVNDVWQVDGIFSAGRGGVSGGGVAVKASW